MEALGGETVTGEAMAETHCAEGWPPDGSREVRAARPRVGVWEVWQLSHNRFLRTPIRRVERSTAFRAGLVGIGCYVGSRLEPAYPETGTAILFSRYADLTAALLFAPETRIMAVIASKSATLAKAS
jgi:hypothetical protein